MSNFTAVPWSNLADFDTKSNLVKFNLLYFCKLVLVRESWEAKSKEFADYGNRLEFFLTMVKQMVYTSSLHITENNPPQSRGGDVNNIIIHDSLQEGGDNHFYPSKASFIYCISEYNGANPNFS